LSNAEDRLQDDILWDDSEQSGEGSSSSKNEKGALISMSLFRTHQLK
jgi:hypothetical protein